MVDGGNLVVGEDKFLESLRSSNIIVPREIPTPTPAPNRDCPVACQGGPLAFRSESLCFLHVLLFVRNCSAN